VALVSRVTWAILVTITNRETNRIGVLTGEDSSDNKKNGWGFNRLGVKKYCENQEYNFEGDETGKTKAYWWCCKYGAAIRVDFTQQWRNKQKQVQNRKNEKGRTSGQISTTDHEEKVIYALE